MRSILASPATRLLIAVVLLSVAPRCLAQTYEHGAVARTESSLTNAINALESLDSRQRLRASIIPARLIEMPVAYNYPDGMTYAVVTQPASTEDDASCATDSSYVDLLPDNGTFDGGLCYYSYLPEYDVSTHNSLSSALAAIGNLSPPKRASLIFHRSPTADVQVNPIWVLAWRKTLEICK
jgi:hypothetical protein